MQEYKYLLKKTSKKSRIKALVLGFAVSVLTFASVLSKCRANIAIGSKGDTELGRMFVASFSNLQYCELGLFPVFSAIFLLLLTDCGFEREMFVLKQPEKIGRLTRSKILLACFMLTSGAILGLLVFAIFWRQISGAKNNFLLPGRRFEFVFFSLVCFRVHDVCFGKRVVKTFDVAVVSNRVLD
jgi:hypothetical protein